MRDSAGDSPPYMHAYATQPSDHTSLAAVTSPSDGGSHSSGARYAMLDSLLASSCSVRALDRLLHCTVAGPAEP